MDTSISSLARKLNRDWPAVAKADVAAAETLAKIRTIVAGVDSDTINVVVFGSLARGEWTSGSDLDWTILVDGEADHEHANTANELASRFAEAGFAPPGKTRTFGTLTFSHEIIHQIGGLDDTNRNTTRRCLLLLESRPVHHREAYDRVIKGVLRRYLQNDFRPFGLRVPRFLTNDLHRFWLTMCVDYASKFREQAANEWAIRNVKLRMSRKLTFASGLIMCGACHQSWIKTADPNLAAEPSVDGMVDYLRRSIARSPLGRLADALEKAGALAAAEKVFHCYDSYLGLIDQPEVRARLKALPVGDGLTDPVFRELQDLCNAFEVGLEELFFDDPLLRNFTRRYGVF